MTRIVVGILMLLLSVSCSDSLTEETILDEFTDHDIGIVSLEVSLDGSEPKVTYGQNGYRVENASVVAVYEDGTRADVTLFAEFSGLPFESTGENCSFTVSYAGISVEHTVAVDSLDFYLKPRSVDYDFFAPKVFSGENAGKVFVGWNVVSDGTETESGDAIPRFPIVNMSAEEICITPVFKDLDDVFDMEDDVIKGTIEPLYEFYGIPKSVKGIGDYAFSRNSMVKAIDFEDGSLLESIGERAFYFSALQYIEIPKSLTKLGEFAFCSASQLRQVFFEDGSALTSIPKEAFSVIVSTEITVPKSVRSIGRSAFGMDVYVERIVFEEGTEIEEIDPNAFELDYSLKEIVFINPSNPYPPAGYENAWGAGYFGAKVIWNGVEL